MRHLIILLALPCSLLAFQAPPYDRPVNPYGTVLPGRAKDEEITNKFKERLLEDSTLRKYVEQINIHTQNSVVTLQGNIDSHAARIMLEQKANNMSDVRRVINLLTVDPTPPDQTPPYPIQ